MILFTQINVPMTDFKIDVMLGGTLEEHQLVQGNRYGFSGDDLLDIENNESVRIETGKEAIVKNKRTFLLHLDGYPSDNIPVFIHELWHLMWHISKTISDFRLNQETSLWAANMIETIARDIINAKYEELNLEYGE